MRRFALIVLLAACGGGSGDDGDDVDSGGGGEARCAGASSDRYFPFEVGNEWEFRVTDPTNGEVYTKIQTLDEEMTPAGEDPVIVQTTTKANGRTETWNRVVGDAIVRVRQQDFDAANALELTTAYDPHNLRLDEAADHVTDGATWAETYTEVYTDPAGAPIESVENVDQWLVVGVDEPCSAPIGNTTCLHLRRTRTQGGIAVKEFWYARGIGKIKETGGQTEELVSCSLE